MTGRKWTERTELLLKDDFKKLESKHVLVMGLGGVGGIAAEMIVRSGVGEITIADGDTVDISNINRQIMATHENIGQKKAEVTAARLRSINPNLKIHLFDTYFTGEMMDTIDLSAYDYIVDAIDTLTPKTRFVTSAYRQGKKIVSSMGAGGRIDPTQVKISDISKSHNCKLARALRKRLYKRDIKKGITVVYSAEDIQDDCFVETDGSNNKKSTIGTLSVMPNIFGLYCATVVIRGLLEKEIG